MVRKRYCLQGQRFQREKSLPIYSTMSTDSERKTFRKLAAEFVQELDSIRVKIHFPGNDYENTPSTPFSLF
ncbi:hypothetical protein MOD89_17405 [Bacillus atrophaeus]|nr:hypothetical protein [Bacillus atrophaeus]